MCTAVWLLGIITKISQRNPCCNSNKLLAFLTRVIFFFVKLFVKRNDWTRTPAITIFNNPILLTPDATQPWIIHRLSPAWLVSRQDLSAGIAVPGLLTRGSSSAKLARHAFQDLGVPGCIIRTIKHQSYKHRPKKIRKKN